MHYPDTEQRENSAKKSVSTTGEHFTYLFPIGGPPSDVHVAHHMFATGAEDNTEETFKEVQERI